MEFRSYPNPNFKLGKYPKDIQKPSVYYTIMQRATQLALAGFFKIRVFNRHNEPTSGGVLITSNHQSFLDPPLVGAALKRPCNFMARDTLFSNPIFGKIISSLHAMPIKRGTADTGAMKESMRRLKAGNQVVIFPEGTRSKDGRLKPFLPGMALLSQRSAEWTLPTIVDGAFECWPRNKKLPSSGKIYVAYGEPIHRSEARKFKAADFVTHLRSKMIELQCQLRKHVGKTPHDYSNYQ